MTAVGREIYFVFEELILLTLTLSRRLFFYSFDNAKDHHLHLIQINFDANFWPAVIWICIAPWVILTALWYKPMAFARLTCRPQKFANQLLKTLCDQLDSAPPSPRALSHLIDSIKRPINRSSRNLTPARNVVYESVYYYIYTLSISKARYCGRDIECWYLSVAHRQVRFLFIYSSIAGHRIA